MESKVLWWPVVSTAVVLLWRRPLSSTPLSADERHVVVYPNIANRLLVALEWVLVLIQIVVAALVLDIPGLLVWIYALGLVWGRFLWSNLWNHSLVWYPLSLLFCFDWYQGSLSCLLFVVVLTQRASRPIALYSYQHAPNPEPAESALSLLTFEFISPMVQRALATGVELWELRNEDRTGTRQWGVGLAVLFTTVYAMATFGPVIFVKQILDYTVTGLVPQKWDYVAGVFISGMVKSLAHGQALIFGKRVAMHIRSMYVSRVYHKLIYSKRHGGSCSTSASNHHVLNLLSVDGPKVGNLADNALVLLSSAIQVVIGAGLLYSLVGRGALGVLVLLTPTSWMFDFDSSKWAHEMDNRVAATEEALRRLKNVRVFGWENAFVDRIDAFRARELARWMSRAWYWVALGAWTVFTPTVAAGVSFAMDHTKITVPVAFTVVAIYAVLKSTAEDLMYCFAGMAQAQDSLERINVFLNDGDEGQAEATPGDKLLFETAVFSWPSRVDFKLCVDVEIPLNKFTAVVGPTGSGKSALLLALLGELQLESGRLKVPQDARMAYCAQTLWLMDTVQESILFGSEYRPDKYKKVLQLCMLSIDNAKVDELTLGMKQQVALARALYSNTDILLLDDCLGAVDAQTAEQIYANIRQDGRTVVAVANVESDFVLNLQGGHLSPLDQFREPVPPTIPTTTVHFITKDTQLDQRDEPRPHDIYRATRKYLEAMGRWAWLYLGLIAVQLCGLAQLWWVLKWAQNGDQVDLFVFLGLGAAVTLCSALVEAGVYKHGTRASRELYKRMLQSCLGVKSTHYENTPIGRFMNRFARDTEQMDELPPLVKDIAFGAFSIISIITIISVTAPVIMVPGLAVVLFYMALLRYYLPTARQLQRLETSSRTPLLKHFNETVHGAVTIRSFHMETQYVDRLATKLDDTHIPSYYHCVLKLWLNLRLECAGTTILALTAAAAVYHRIDVGWAAIALTCALSLNDAVVGTVTSWSTMESGMDSVDRIIQYSTLDQEPDGGDDEPYSGELVFDNVSARMSGRAALTHINLKIDAGSKVAIVGPGGAGKSTILNVVYRLVECETGRVLLGSRDIALQPLSQLRADIAIIPQDPVLFKDSLRFNLDPSGDMPDEELVNVLETVDFPTCDLEFDKFDRVASDHRQLICVARALLRKPKVVILDETVPDHRSKDIRQLVLDSFKHCTILMVSQRVENLNGIQRVVVLHEGQVVQDRKA